MASNSDSSSALAPTGPQSQVAPPQSAFLQLDRALRTGDLPAAQQAYGQIQASATTSTLAKRAERTGSWQDAIAELDPAIRQNTLSAAQLAVTPGRTAKMPVQMAATSYTALGPAAKGGSAQTSLGTLLNVSL